MRILFLSPAYYPPFPGGGERYVRALAQGLLTQGHHVTVVSSCARLEQDLWRGCTALPESDEAARPPVWHCPLAPFPGGRLGLLACRKLMVLISALPGDQTKWLERLAHRFPALLQLPETLAPLGVFDLVHAFNLSWEYPALVGYDFAQKHGLPFVLTPFMHFGAAEGDRVARNTTMQHQQRLLRQAHAVAVLTSIEREGLLQLGLMANRVVTIGAGLDPLPVALLNGDALCEAHRITQPFVLFVGRNSYDKGALHAAQAVLRLNREGERLQLVLIGQMTPEFRRFYARLGAAEQQHLRPLGIVPEDEKHALLEACEALLLPSRTDSFGIVILEAWAHGRPVIGAQAGGIPGVIDAGENGLLVPFGDVTALSEALRLLRKDPLLAQRLGAQGYKKVTQVYHWKEVCRKTESLYAQLTGPASPRSTDGR